MKVPRELPVRPLGVSVYLARGQGPDAEFLVMRRAVDDGEFGGLWQQVTGGIEHDETAWQAALREAEEETGIRPRRLYSADLTECFYDWDRDCMILFPVFYVPVEPDQAVTLSADHDRYEWLTVEAACDRFSFRPQKDNLRKIHEEFLLKLPDEHLRIPLTEPTP